MTVLVTGDVLRDDMGMVLRRRNMLRAWDDINDNRMKGPDFFENIAQRQRSR